MDDSNKRKLIGFYAFFTILGMIATFILAKLLFSGDIPTIILFVGSIIIGGIVEYCYGVHANRKLQRFANRVTEDLKDLSDALHSSVKKRYRK